MSAPPRSSSHRPLRRLAAVAIATTVAAGTLTACGSGGSGGSGDATVNVVTELYPFTWLVEEIGGDRVDVTQLMPPGGEIHSFELSPRQVDQLGRADLAVVTRGAAAAVDDALAENTPGVVVDVADIVTLLPAVAHDDEHDEDEHEGEGEADEHDGDADHDEHDHGDFDTHTWLAIPELPKVAEAIGAALAEIDPDGAAEYEASAAAVSTRLAELDTAYRDGLASCSSTAFLITHPSFGYVANAYGLEQIGIGGIDSETEPSPARIAEVSKIAVAEGATVVFFPGTSNPKVADVLAEDLGLRVDHLDELTAAEPGTDLVGLAEDNLATLRDALGCS
ncbi:zinc transport system substrate-binding protein [Salana multivorans]|uniref:Zinc transport system substrate-binding protein n=1 Tax=Salana multivorans TaxID=120377 RepID=A0A3N2D0F5_9MICO|nr:metal ABC transporter substrate-binding protein [Salana multivorans]ROR93249.1 zinc transport system substrate-binding protein [Salana multivorans]